MKALKWIAVLAAACFLMAACGGSSTNGNGNANRPANSNAATRNAVATSTGTKTPVTPVSQSSSGENVYTHREGGIQFEAPANWKAEAEGDTITVTAPDNSIAMSFTVIEQADVAEAARVIDAEMEKVMQNAEAEGEAEQKMHNGMTLISQSGTGTVSGNQILWSCALIMAKKPVLAYAFAAPGLFEQHTDELEKLIHSIKPIN